MTWQSKTASDTTSGTSSMGAGTELNRAMSTLPSNTWVTAIEVTFQLGWITPAGTYGSLAGAQAQPPLWRVGVSAVPTLGTVPGVLSDPDNGAFLFISFFDLIPSKTTINTTASTNANYQDQFQWSGRTRTRLQLPFSTGGSINFHICNPTAATVSTAWNVFSRTTYAT